MTVIHFGSADEDKRPAPLAAQLDRPSRHQERFRFTGAEQGEGLTSVYRFRCGVEILDWTGELSHQDALRHTCGSVMDSTDHLRRLSSAEPGHSLATIDFKDSKVDRVAGCRTTFCYRWAAQVESTIKGRGEETTEGMAKRTMVNSDGQVQQTNAGGPVQDRHTEQTTAVQVLPSVGVRRSCLSRPGCARESQSSA